MVKKLFKLVGMVILIFVPFYGISAQTSWYNPATDSLLPIQGRYWNKEIGSAYQRLPQRAKETVRLPLWNLSLQTAGLYVKFYTDAPSVEVKYTVTGGLSMPHMPSTGVSGVDLYTTDSEGRQFWCQGNYQFGDTVRYHYTNLTYRNNHGKGSEFTLFLPLYNGVKSLQIGVLQGSRFEFLRPSSEKPVVVYGTSIAQGACASRPGMAWTNILQRRLDMPIINLGFSGNGKLDETFFELLSEIDAALFVIDCMPNMAGDQTAFIAPRMKKGLRLLRTKSKAPILLVEHDGYMGHFTNDKRGNDFKRTNVELRKVYEEMKEETGNLHYLTFEELGLSMDSQVDGVHASDLGMQQYADAYYPRISSLLFPELASLKFKPCRQYRDSFTYNWAKRHEDVLTHNAAHQPEIVMIGNSITHFWGGEPYEKRREADDVWQKMFKKRRAVNLGYGWDRIENIEWRILHGELDGFDARQVFMMIGTNNLDFNTDEEIVDGIREVVSIVKKKQPKAKLYVVKILPRRGREVRLVRLNSLLEKSFVGDTVVKVLDVSAPLLDKNGKVNEKLFIDGLHPNHKGYELLAKQLKDYIE